jgi:hypothetical protein
VAGTHLLGILLLVVRVTDSSDFGTHSLGEDKSEMSKTSDTNDTDVLGGSSSAILLQGRVDGGTTTKHGCSLSGVKRVGDVYGKVRRTSPLVGVSTLTLVSLSILSSRKDTSVCTTDTVGTVLLSV